VSAIISEQEKRMDAAREIYETILSRMPLFAPAAKRLAALYADLGDDKKAFELATKARETYPQDADLAKTLGIVVFRRGDYAWSARLLKESARKHSTDAMVFYYLGKALQNTKEKRESVEALQRALTLGLTKQFADDAQKVIDASKQL